MRYARTMSSSQLDELEIEVSSRVILGGMTKVEFAYEQVRHWILSGKLAPETELDQGTLAKTLGVSTTPMREALSRLQAEELLSIRAHHRVVVAALSKRELEEIYEVRFELDPLATKLAANRISADEIDQLGLMIEQRPEDASGRIALNRKFHSAIYRASANIVLVRILDSLHDRATRYRLILMGSEQDTAIAYMEHKEIVNALRRRNAEELSHLTRAHLEASKASIETELAQSS